MDQLQKRDWLLLILDSAEGRSLSPVQLQKTLFLLKEKAPNVVGDGFYNFIPYNYGPFDAAIYSDAEALQAENLVAISAPTGQRWKNYSLTQQGADTVRRLKENLNTQHADYLRKLVGWVLAKDFNTLLRWIYTQYPRYRKNSVFQGELS
ncbi:hypothetical protein EHM69_05255 [candidate division KSB1 bacterium]|nr:MAG: hypothetical protein EHM69_05255 [candidate division KSB1 bacterium]